MLVLTPEQKTKSKLTKSPEYSSLIHTAVKLHHHIGVTSNFLIKTKLIKMLFKNADVKRAQHKFTTIILQVQRQTKVKAWKTTNNKRALDLVAWALITAEKRKKKKNSRHQQQAWRCYKAVVL